MVKKKLILKEEDKEENIPDWGIESKRMENIDISLMRFKERPPLIKTKIESMRLEMDVLQNLYEIVPDENETTKIQA